MTESSAPAPRYAVYFVPAADSALYRFGASVLGYDCYSGAEVALDAQVAGFRLPWREVVREPRRYGFHATLKAPFPLAAGASEADLAEAMERFARQPRAMPEVALDVRLLGRFVALTPHARCEPLQRLAADCVTAFDRFRAPLSASERARRLAAPLTEAQVAHLDRWGYPYVFDEFRFHMTLTGPLDAADRDELAAMLGGLFARRVDAGVHAIDRLSLLRQDVAGLPFVLVRQWPLRG